MRQASADLEFRGAMASVKINLDGSGRADLASGSAFLDHMLSAFLRTAQADLEVKASGSSFYRALTLGRTIGLAINDALGDHSGIRRYGSATVPMDDSLAEIAMDLGGRFYLVFRGEFVGSMIGDLDVQEIMAFMEGLADGAKMTLHIGFYGENDHHKAESVFKALGFAIREAASREGSGIPSTKGVI